MMNMKGKQKFNEAGNKAKKLCAELFCENDGDMNPYDLQILQIILGYINATEQIIAEREQALKDINEKLDKLLMKEEGSK